MRGRRLAVSWSLLTFTFALAAIALIFISRAGAAPRVAGSRVASPRTSSALASTTHKTTVVPAATATPALIDILHAADALAKAGLLPPTPMPPPLIDILHAADELVKAGVIAPPPTMLEILQAADALVKAGFIAPPPTMLEILQAADVLVKAGVIAPPPAADPPLIEILHAVQILDAAGQLPGSRPAAEPQPQVAPPPPPPPTPMPPRATATPIPPPPPAPPRVQAVQPGRGAGWFDDAFTGRVFALVNQRRAAAGLAPVAVEPRLANSAATYAQVLIQRDWFSHTGPDGSTLVTRNEAAGFAFTVQEGEVLAWGTAGWQPEALVQAWMDSPPHHEELMSPVYTRAGAGCYFSPAAGVTVKCAMEFAG